ncbi:hypothetical protein Tco_0521748 [Tanacetum coccineum]
MTMDWNTNNALWLYWTRGDDEEVLTDEELSDLEEEKVSEEKEIVEIFRIKTDIFDSKTPLCKEFKEFNHLLQIDMDVLARDLHGFKTYDDYMDAYIYKWNKEVPLVEEKPCLDDGTWKEPDDKICHECKPFQFKSGHIEWPTCNSNEDGYCNGGHLPGMIQEDYLEEEVAETMAETMEQYMTKTRADYGSGVARPKIEDKDHFELKGQFLKELRGNTFSDSNHEDANEHIEKVLKIEVILFYNRLEVPTRQILNSRGAIPTKTATDAKVAIQEMEEYSQKWHNGTSKTRSTETSDRYPEQVYE